MSEIRPWRPGPVWYFALGVFLGTWIVWVIEGAYVPNADLRDKLDAICAAVSCESEETPDAR